MVALWLTQMVATRSAADTQSSLSLYLCIAGLLGIFAVGYAGYFAFDAIWPGFYYKPIAVCKNAWLIAQALCIVVYFTGLATAFNGLPRALNSEAYA